MYSTFSLTWTWRDWTLPGLFKVQIRQKSPKMHEKNVLVGKTIQIYVSLHTKNKAALLYSPFHIQLAVQILWANRFVECSAHKKLIAKLYCQLIKKRRVIKVFSQTANFEFLYIVNTQFYTMCRPDHLRSN